MALKNKKTIKTPTLGEKTDMYFKLDNFLIRLIPRKDPGTGEIMGEEIRMLLKGYESEEARNDLERDSNMNIEISIRGEKTTKLKELLAPFIAECYKMSKEKETKIVQKEKEDGTFEDVEEIVTTIPDFDWEDSL